MSEAPVGWGSGEWLSLQTPAACVLRVTGPSSQGDCEEWAWPGCEAPTRCSAAPGSPTCSTHSPGRALGSSHHHARSCPGKGLLREAKELESQSPLAGVGSDPCPVLCVNLKTRCEWKALSSECVCPKSLDVPAEWREPTTDFTSSVGSSCGSFWPSGWAGVCQWVS